MRSVSGTPRGFGSPARTQILTLHARRKKVPRTVTTQMTTFFYAQISDDLGQRLLRWQCNVPRPSAEIEIARSANFFAVWQRKFKKIENKNFFPFTRTTRCRWTSFRSAESLDGFDRLINVDSYPISNSKFIYVDSNASTKRYGRLGTSRKRNVTVDAPEHATKCFFNGAVRCNPKFISSFNVWCRGQDAASEAHHWRNTNVVGNKAGIPRIAIGNERQKKEEGEVWLVAPSDFQLCELGSHYRISSSLLRIKERTKKERIKWSFRSTWRKGLTSHNKMYRIWRGTVLRSRIVLLT
jgi:hypothetical protein